jgi:molybdopterin-guanine dinucleotide biosynthesis adapter protein
MRIVAVVGFSESGKTRLLIRLIRELKGRGFRVAAVKRCSHGFALDTEGKDSADFSRAGADGVAMIAPDRWAAIGTAAAVDPSRWAGRLFPDADVVLVEGGKDVRGLRKIEVLRGDATPAASRPDELIALVADGPRSGTAVPVFSADDISGVADLIVAQGEAGMTEIRLEVDGQEINLNAFVQTFIEKTVVGMVTSLSGIDPEPRRIRLEIDRPGGPVQGGPKP